MNDDYLAEEPHLGQGRIRHEPLGIGGIGARDWIGIRKPRIRHEPLGDGVWFERVADSEGGTDAEGGKTPTPEDTREIAEGAVKIVRESSGVELDFSPESLKHVDRLLVGWHEGGVTCRGKPAVALVFGCYLGEVIVRNHGGRWRNAEEANYPSNFPLVLELPSGTLCSPLGKACKLLDNGIEESVSYFDHVVTEGTAGILASREGEDAKPQ